MRLNCVLQILHGKILEDEIPVYVVTFATQEVLLFRNAKTGEIMVGAENRVEQCHYAAVITRIEAELDNELTGGWKVVEVRTRVSTKPRLYLSMSSRWAGDLLASTCRRVAVLPQKLLPILDQYTHNACPAHAALTRTLTAHI